MTAGYTLIPTSSNSQLYKDAVDRFHTSWVHPVPMPAIINLFYVNHQDQELWKNYQDYKKQHGNEQYLWNGSKRACNLADDNLQVTACQLVNCGVCSILRGRFEPSMAKASGMFGLGTYFAPNSSKSSNTRLYLQNVNDGQSPNLVLFRCAVVLGNSYPAKAAMVGATAPPPTYDSITGIPRSSGGAPTLRYLEMVMFEANGILPIEVIVLRFSDPTNMTQGRIAPVDPHINFTKMLTNVTDADWNKYPEAIRDTRKGDILWTDGSASWTFPSAPRIRAYKVVKRVPPSPTGKVVAEGYAASNPFYFKLE